MRDIPVRISVVGSPLVIQKERVLVKCLSRPQQEGIDLDFGQIQAGVPLEQCFYVFNTGIFSKLSAHNLPLQGIATRLIMLQL